MLLGKAMTTFWNPTWDKCNHVSTYDIANTKFPSKTRFFIQHKHCEIQDVLNTRFDKKNGMISFKSIQTTKLIQMLQMLTLKHL